MIIAIVFVKKTNITKYKVRPSSDNILGNNKEPIKIIEQGIIGTKSIDSSKFLIFEIFLSEKILLIT